MHSVYALDFFLSTLIIVMVAVETNFLQFRCAYRAVQLCYFSILHKFIESIVS